MRRFGGQPISQRGVVRWIKKPAHYTRKKQARVVGWFLIPTNYTSLSYWLPRAVCICISRGDDRRYPDVRVSHHRAVSTSRTYLVRHLSLNARVMGSVPEVRVFVRKLTHPGLELLPFWTVTPPICM